MSAPTERTLTELRERGWCCQVVEKFNPWAKPHGVRVDLFGVIDIVAMKDGCGIVGIQCTSAAHRKDHREKILASVEAKLWTLCGGRLWLMTWYGRKLIGTSGLRNSKKTWTLSVEEFWPKQSEQDYAVLALSDW